MRLPYGSFEELPRLHKDASHAVKQRAASEEVLAPLASAPTIHHHFHAGTVASIRQDYAAGAALLSDPHTGQAAAAVLFSNGQVRDAYRDVSERQSGESMLVPAAPMCA